VDVEHLPGRALNRDISRGELVDADLDRLIERRHEKRVLDEGERAEEEVWREAERREEAKRQQEWQQGRLAFCEHLTDVYTRLADEHAVEAEKLRAQTEGAA
jgi:hypothetical protein